MSRLYLITPPLTGTEAFAPRLAQALGLGDVASVLVRLAKGADSKRVVAPLVEVCVAHDVALLIEDDVRLAARLGADGVHVHFGDVAGAVESFKSERIVGAGGVHLRDDAMTAGQDGADYVMFGEPDAHGVAPPLEATLERVEWWAEIFETPCVAYAARLADVAPLAAAKADFIALDGAIWDAADLAEAMAAAMKAARA